MNGKCWTLEKVKRNTTYYAEKERKVKSTVSQIKFKGRTLDRREQMDKQKQTVRHGHSFRSCRSPKKGIAA